MPNLARLARYARICIAEHVLRSIIADRAPCDSTALCKTLMTLRLRWVKDVFDALSDLVAPGSSIRNRIVNSSSRAGDHSDRTEEVPP